MVVRRRGDEGRHVQHHVAAHDAIADGLVVVQVAPDDLQAGAIQHVRQDFAVLLAVAHEDQGVIKMRVLYHALEALHAHAAGGAGQKYGAFLHVLTPASP